MLRVRPCARTLRRTLEHRPDAGGPQLPWPAPGAPRAAQKARSRALKSPFLGVLEPRAAHASARRARTHRWAGLEATAPGAARARGNSEAAVGWLHPARRTAL